mmetsp:Transcript_27618/g.60005  ORF Transcript_27618/g.60005 Transcript_27618/m.60005 type:complete len:536 (+) Transcript_27618:467-2074(+)|eukprot:CAMPEP_0206427796 /NCGR_PEP_ID=MMETSP0324_2-20121206/5257_1 /ASSEMBLY_ACC=CAM_ASM_000836 /TAXON_ID=2866 /ORGANISM="Crypthecodinium cohnii, Strain Seligo" /LENGTH=535 /DNA_ID=CAMNT_0053893151 /DNA_START=456 /DNA_END=2063 /DNA_ORIENTATION=-
MGYKGRDSALEHLDPTPAKDRRWRWYTYASMWAALCLQPGTYSFGGALISMGLNPLESLIATAIGNVLTATAIVINSAPGVAYGIPFPVYARASFGISGAKVAGLSRGLVGILWLSFQHWISTIALVQGFAGVWPKIGESPMIFDPYLDLAHLVVLIFVTSTSATCVRIGVEKFDRLLYFAAPMGTVFFLVVLVFIVTPAWSGCSLEEELQLQATKAEAKASEGVFPWIVGINILVSMLSTVMMNAADLSRLAPRQFDQAFGQMLGIPLPKLFVVGVGILGAAVVQLRTGKPSWMMGDLFQFWPPWAGVLGAIMIYFLTLSINIAVNIIPPANDFMNLAPRSLKWRHCAYGVILCSFLACPFLIFHTAAGFAELFLGGYGMVTGALYGVMVSDYYIVRGQHLSLPDLYAEDISKSAFGYYKGHNWRAAVAALAGASLPCPAWIVQMLNKTASSPSDQIVLPTFWAVCGGASWFIASSVAAVVYVTCCRLFPLPGSLAATEACGEKEVDTDISDSNDSKSVDESDSGALTSKSRSS